MNVINRNKNQVILNYIISFFVLYNYNNDTIRMMINKVKTKQNIC
jgi:hypothetical protein